MITLEAGLAISCKKEAGLELGRGTESRGANNDLLLEVRGGYTYIHKDSLCYTCSQNDSLYCTCMFYAFVNASFKYTIFALFSPIVCQRTF
jgi:hypothetical protein